MLIASELRPGRYENLPIRKYISPVARSIMAYLSDSDSNKEPWTLPPTPSDYSGPIQIEYLGSIFVKVPQGTSSEIDPPVSLYTGTLYTDSLETEYFGAPIPRPPALSLLPFQLWQDDLAGAIAILFGNDEWRRLSRRSTARIMWYLL